MSDTQPSDPIKKAEQLGYSKGYAAGARRKSRDADARKARARRSAFWERCFVAALPACIEANGWKKAGTPISNISERTQLAADFADEAVKKWKPDQ